MKLSYKTANKAVVPFKSGAILRWGVWGDMKEYFGAIFQIHVFSARGAIEGQKPEFSSGAIFI